MDAIIRESKSRACAVAFPAADKHSKELGPFQFAGDEQKEVLGMQMSDAKEQEQSFVDQLKLDGVPQFKEDRRRDWLAFPMESRASIRRLHTLIGHMREH